MVKRVFTKCVITSWGGIDWNESEWEFYDGPVAECCGAPSGQSQLAAAQSAFYTQETQEQQQLFSQEESLITNINDIYLPIFDKGPSQLGFSAGELQNLYSEASTGTSQDFGAASKVLKEGLATEGGGNTQLPSGVTTKAEAGLAAGGAAQLSSEENQILQADYQQGYSEFQAASNALMGEGQILNPAMSAGQVANAGGQAANQTYSAIAQENNSVFGAVMGALGGAASSYLGTL